MSNCWHSFWITMRLLLQIFKRVRMRATVISRFLSQCLVLLTLPGTYFFDCSFFPQSARSRRRSLWSSMADGDASNGSVATIFLKT
ncbi:hypothetical protein BDQ94DRAFT_152772 [Aspergillus welwitschiae]|uniref:Uncharacterized protein n=1 Tax=Aspergillus welwitschiae TaxID=1341132 RepID=A0A3F3PPE3_9EURO|nr:hypothetical protein BDQ94DRAFT_152772 [Aspergillus welwitschiae]RDH28206.1 hypothetical protein BDQ94DRAFT_152772 [Aspergillus welwitschiae]